jgi:hypothetical protein
MVFRLPGLVVILVMVAGCSAPSPDAGPEPASSTAAPSTTSSATTMPQPATPFEPTTERWDGSTTPMVCVSSGGSTTCTGIGSGDAHREVPVPAGAGNVSVTVTWSDPAMRMLNLGLYGATEEGLVARGSSPLSLSTPILTAEPSLWVYVAQYVADAGAAHAQSAVEFSAELTFTA